MEELEHLMQMVVLEQVEVVPAEMDE